MLSHTLVLCHIHCHTCTHTTSHTVSHSHTVTHIQTHSPTCLYSHTHSHTGSHAHTYTHSPAYTPSHTYAHSHTSISQAVPPHGLSPVPGPQVPDSEGHRAHCRAWRPEPVRTLDTPQVQLPPFTDEETEAQKRKGTQSWSPSQSTCCRGQMCSKAKESWSLGQMCLWSPCCPLCPSDTCMWTAAGVGCLVPPHLPREHLLLQRVRHQSRSRATANPPSSLAASENACLDFTIAPLCLLVPRWIPGLSPCHDGLGLTRCAL